jgi:hypothetical protein
MHSNPVWRALMQAAKLTKVVVAASVALFICVLAVVGWQKYKYPFGRRPAGISLPGIYGSLVAYAGDHNGWLPQSSKGAYDALQKLFDSYCPSGKELAGVSGNINAVTNALRTGKPLDPSLTSWNYVPGYRISDPGNAAVLWESRPGLYYDGRRNSFGGRAVLFLNGDISNIPAVDWTNFLKKQDELRKLLQSSRMPGTNF